MESLIKNKDSNLVLGSDSDIKKTITITKIITSTYDPNGSPTEIAIKKHTFKTPIPTKVNKEAYKSEI